MVEALRTLDEIACRHGADKSSEQHGFTAVYERLFEPRRDEALTLLEIGVFEGASLGMWREYFPSARIFAIDFLLRMSSTLPPIRPP